jgi:hypothetical protein
MGSNGFGYYTTNPALNTVYRPTKMVISPVTDDLGGGYCLDQTQANDWAQYTINVLVPQTYMVDVRAEAIGASTGGVFQCTFTNGVGVHTSGGFSNSTPPLYMTSTNWTDITNVVYLPSGIYAMKLQCLTNAANGTVGRFNYISIYPWWPPPVIPANSTNVTLSATSNYSTALNNATLIQNAVNTVGTWGGGTVFIPNGTYYVAQPSPNETNDGYANAAVSIMTNNVEMAGAGKTNTTLIAYNRATTVFCLGEDAHTNTAPCSNFILRDMTLAAQPNWAVCSIGTNTNYITGTNIIYDANQLVMGFPNDQNPSKTNGFETGAIVIIDGPAPSSNSYNILITNCEFLEGYDQVTIWNTYVSNVMFRACDFLWISNVMYGNVGVMVAGLVSNCVVMENTFNGNTDLAPTNFAYVSTNPYYGSPVAFAGVGIAWLQIGGNFFVARNTILNNYFEGVQVDMGPNAVVGNTYSSMINNTASCALCASVYAGANNVLQYSTCFVGNSVYGGRYGERGYNGLGQSSSTLYTLNFSGNSLDLYPAYDISGDYPGAAVAVAGSQAANICGNTMTNGGHGYRFQDTNISALILDNNFAGAGYRGIGYVSFGDFVTTAQIFSNILGQGVTFHAQLPYSDSFGWFMSSNIYVTNISTAVPLFTDPASSAIHILN